MLEQDRAAGRARVSLRWDKSAALFPAALLFNLTGGLASFGIIFYARDVFHASAAQIVWLVAMPRIAALPCASGGGLLLQHASFSRVLVITATAILAATAVQVLLAYRPPVRSSW